MLNSQKRKKNTVLSKFITDFTAKNAPTSGVTYDVIDELRRLSLSKCFPALCHKLINEIAIFHSINREICDNTISWCWIRCQSSRISYTYWLIDRLIIIPYYRILPESSRWLMTKQRTDDAYKILRHAAKVNKRPMPEKFLITEDATKCRSLLNICFYPKLVIRTIIISLNW